MDKGTKVRLLSRGGKLGAVAAPGSVRFVAEVDAGTVGTVGDRCGIGGAIEEWFYVEVEHADYEDGLLVPVTDAFVEEVQ